VTCKHTENDIMSISASALLAQFLEVYPFQPATAVWRATETAALADSGLPQGLGLDLGCGDGLLTNLILRTCGSRELVGIDPDDNEIELARESGIYRELHATGGGELPLADNTFDFVISNSVLEHIPDVRPVLAEAARVLKEGGTFVATVPAPNFHKLLRGPLRARHKRRDYMIALDQRLAHYYYWDAETWKQELAKVGLQLESAQPYLNRVQTRRWETISRLTAGILVMVFRGKRPIEIQRTLGMRQPGRRMPATLARIVATFLSLGVDLTPSKNQKGSCLLLRAVKSDVR
jgi:SAM-dependent methyltransferase